MKRIIVLFIMVSIYCSLLPRVSPIVFLGGGYSWVNGKDMIVDSKGVFNWNVGVATDFRLWETPVVSELGLRYIMRGSRYEDSGQGVGSDLYGNTIYWNYDCTSETRLHNIDIFAKAKYEINFLSNMSLLPYIGYGASILLSGKEKNEGDIYNWSYSYTDDTTDDFNTLDHLLLFGIDFTINEKVMVGVEYDMGLVNIMKDNYSEIKTAVFMLNIGYHF